MPGTDIHSRRDAFPATRSSLLERVRDSEDADGWRIFHSQYARLVFHICVKAGLRNEDAEDVSQETLSSVAASMADFKLDRSRGSFRGWLRQVTAHKVADFLRGKYREGAARTELPAEIFEQHAGDVSFTDSAWDAEWQSYLLRKAMETLEKEVSAQAMQVFHLSAVNGWSVDKIRETLGLSRTQVYLAKYRVGLLAKKIVARLRKELE